MEPNIFAAFWEGANLFIKAINWLYIIVFMLTTWLINDHADSSNRANWLVWWSRVDKTIRSLIIGLIIAFLFAWAFSIKEKIEILNLLFSLLFAMVLYKFGIKKVFKILSNKLGLKFDE